MFHVAHCNHSYRPFANHSCAGCVNNSYMTTPGMRIKKEREGRGWSQQRLADEIKHIRGEKISRAAVAKWELGTSKTQKPTNLFAAAKAMGLNPQWVLDGTGDKYTDKIYSSSNITAENVVMSIKPKTRREQRIDEILALLQRIDMEGLAVVLDKAERVVKKYPAIKQTPSLSQ